MAASLLVLVLVTACDSSVPSATPASPASSSTPSNPPVTVQPGESAAADTPVPATAPPAEPSPSASPAADLVPGVLAVTVSDRLRVRSKPIVDDSSALLTPVLPVGTQLQVLDGPVDASGYAWVRVAPVGLTLDKGVADGWVAVADHDGTPWVALAQAPLAGLKIEQASVAVAAVNGAAAKRAAGEINAFGLSMYKRLLANATSGLKGKGVVVSPTSIALALAMARAGARGATATQMDAVLHASGWNDLEAGLGSLQQVLAGHNATWKDDEGTSHSLSLNVVNRAFGQDGWSIEQAYLERIGRAFDSGLALVDYVRDAPAARATINSWVARETADRIPNFLGPTDVTSSTRLALVNAIYMKANWLVEFDEALTANRSFVRANGASIKVPTMHLDGEQNVVLAQGTGWRATELQYAGADGSAPLSMTLILPDDLKTFEAGLSTAKLDAIQAAIAAQRKVIGKITNPNDGDMNCPVFPYETRLFLPKFGIDTRAALVPVLRAMGMRDAVDTDRADFTGVTGGRDMVISKVIHQANIDVDEKGTVAAAATAVIGDTTGGCGAPTPLKVKTLRFDHPFMFLIRDTKTGAILFMGRVTDPSVR
jgi:serpin B